MRFSDPRIEWRINDAENKAREAERKAEQANHEISSLREHVARLECSNGEISSALDGLRNELQQLREET